MRLKLWSIASLLLVAVACTPAKPAPGKQELLRRGDELVKKKDYPAATAAYRAAVVADARDGQVRLKLANAYMNAGNWSDATAEALRAADLLPDDPDAQLLAARLILLQGRYVDVVDRMAVRLRKQPDDVDALILWGNATAHLINSTMALSQLTPTIREDGIFEAARRDVRPGTLAEDDAAAESALRKALALTPTALEAQLAVVNFLWVAGRPDESEAVLRRIADQNPRHALANYALGAFYLARHRNAEGEKFLKNAAASSEYGRDVRFILADYYIAAHRDTEALTLLNSMLRADNEGGEVTLRLAAVEFRNGKRDEALIGMEQLLLRQPHNLRAWLLKAKFLVEDKQLYQAERAVREALADEPKSSEGHATLGEIFSVKSDLESALAELTEAFRLNPGANDLLLPLAELSLRLGHEEEAVQFARDAKRRHPGDQQASLTLVKALILTRDYGGANLELKPLLAGALSSDVLVQLGTIQSAQGNRGAARATLTRALQENRESFDALAGLVSLDLEDGQIASARRRIDETLPSHADDPRFLFLAARVYTAQNDMVQTGQMLRLVLSIDPSNETAAISLADVLNRQRQGDAAKMVLERLLERRPQSVDTRTALGGLLELEGKIEEARAQYEKVVAQNPGAAKAAYKLAAIYVDQTGNLDVALTLASSAKLGLPNDPDVTDTLGWVYVGKNQASYALPFLRAAVQAVPTNAVYRYHLGFAYLRSGDRTNAEAEFERALQLNPNFRFAAQTKAALASMRR